jgi:pSer/pThr/pTyr-binding forkhead associated (FHA) protein
MQEPCNSFDAKRDLGFSRMGRAVVFIMLTMLVQLCSIVAAHAHGAAAGSLAEAQLRVVQDEVAILLRQPSDKSVVIDWRFIKRQPSDRPFDVDVRLRNGQVIPRPASSYEARKERTRVLFLIDNSKSVRDSIGKIKADIRQLYAAFRAQGLSAAALALSQFSNEARPLAAFGSSESFERQLEGVRASGASTEFYRSIRDTLPVLEAADLPVGRRFLLLFSDGKAEDKSYGRADVIDRAREAGIAIYAFGYGPSSATASTDLQNLRRLAEDTGGYYFPPGSYDNRAYVELLNAFLSGGGRTFALRPSETDWPTGAMTLQVDVPEVNKTVQFSITSADYGSGLLDVLRQSLASVWRLLNTTLSILLGIIVLVPLLILLTAWLILRRMYRPAATARADVPPFRGFQLYGQESDSQGADRQGSAGEPATHSAAIFRIGRAPGNDYVVDDPSVADQHAVIRMDASGRYSIEDRSPDGTLSINRRSVRASPLRDGDLITVGDVQFRFLIDAPVKKLPVSLRPLLSDEQIDPPRNRPPIEEWWPALRARLPRLAWQWSTVAVRLKARWPGIYEVLSRQLYNLAVGDAVSLTAAVPFLLLEAIYVLAPLLGRRGGQSFAILDVLSPDPKRGTMVREVYTIGRRPDNDLQIKLPDSVSRYHARIERRRNGEAYEFIVRDLGSTNGVLVNHRRIREQARLQDGDLLELGGAAIRFLAAA